MLDDKIKKELLKLTNMEEIGKFLIKNNISLLIEDNEIQKHLKKYYSFPDDGIIRDLRNK